MDLRLPDDGPSHPFEVARDRFETTCDLDLPVRVRLREDPDARTWAGHYDDYHVLNISRRAASSAMAPELALHEYAHMRRYEQRHPSHTQSIDEAVMLAFPGRSVERRKLLHCAQIANHMKDVYADDITLRVGPPDKLVAFFESELAGAVADRPTSPPDQGWTRLTPGADPDITAINAAFALALLERHDALPADHRLYEFAQVAGSDAPGVDLSGFRRRFRDLARDPDESEFRKALVDAARAYVLPDEHAAD